MTKLSTIALSVALALGVAACSPQQTEQQQTSAAAQQEQQQLTSGLRLDAFNTNVRPQDDLFQYVNGTWYDNTEMPADKSRIGSFLELRELNQERLRGLIEKASAQNAAAGTNEQKIGDFFNSYMDVETLNELGYQPIADDLAAIAAIETHDDVVERFAELTKMGVGGPFGFYVYGDKKNPTHNGLYMSQSGLNLPDRDYYLKDDEKSVEIRAAYKAYIQDVLDLVDYADAAAAADAVLALETQIAEVQWSRVESRNADKTYNPQSREGMRQLLKDRKSVV